MNRTALVASNPAPIGGLNVVDSLVAMKQTDATVLRNMFSRPYGLEVRKGCVRHATRLGLDEGLPFEEPTQHSYGTGIPVKTLAAHITSTGASRLYAFAGQFMYDVTTPNDLDRTPILYSLANSIWNGVSISNASGLNQTLYNGADDGIWIKNDFTIARITQSATPLTPGLGELNIDPAILIDGTVHQKRVWLVEKNSTRAWFLEPETISGIATMFDFGSIFQRGGHLVAVASWTVDSGSGMDDVFVAVSSQGEIAIYTGRDPAGVDTWYLKGVFVTAAPVGNRCLTKVDGDLLLLTQFGLLSLSDAIAQTTTSGSEGNFYLSKNVQYLLQGLTESLYGVFGWVVLYWPDNNALLINVPIASGSGQLVQSTLTKGWSQFDNWDAVSFITFNGLPVFGDRGGNVWRAWEGYTDGAIQEDAVTIIQGTPVLAEVQTAFNFFESTATIKHAKMVRPTFIGTSQVLYKLQVNAEFDYNQAVNPGTIGPPSAESLWGSAIWGTDVWGTGDPQTQRVWSAVAGIGSAFALRMAFRANTPVLWASYDLMYSTGSGI
jgi:hypothetical protein